MAPVDHTPVQVALRVVEAGPSQLHAGEGVLDHVLGFRTLPDQEVGHADHRLVPPSAQVVEAGRPADRRVSAYPVARPFACSGGRFGHGPAKPFHVSLTDGSVKWFRPTSAIEYSRHQGLGAKWRTTARCAQPKL